jgi:hypothetical protein
MLPENLVFDEVRTPKNLVELIDLCETTYKVDYEQTSLEQLSLSPDGFLQSPQGESFVTRNFLERCAATIGMPSSYAYKITPDLFCENFRSRHVHTTTPVTVCRIGGVAVGLTVDKARRYRPVPTAELLQRIGVTLDLEFRRAAISFFGVDVEFVQPGNVIEPSVGDILEVGVTLTNSETGDRQLKASASSYRLVCTNGAIMSDVLGVARGTNDYRMTNEGIIRAFYKDFGGLVGKLPAVSKLYRDVSQLKIPYSEMWQLWRKAACLVSRSEADEVIGVTEDERREFQLAAEQGEKIGTNPSTHEVYDVHNRLTFAAHGRPLSVRRGLQLLGGGLLSRATEWSTRISLN